MKIILLHKQNLRILTEIQKIRDVANSLSWRRKKKCGMCFKTLFILKHTDMKNVFEVIKPKNL